MHHPRTYLTNPRFLRLFIALADANPGPRLGNHLLLAAADSMSVNRSAHFLRKIRSLALPIID